MHNPLFIIDVREPHEYAQGYAKGAVNIPVGDLTESKVLAKIPKTAHIKLYCRSGQRAEMAKYLLHKIGYINVDNVVNKDHFLQ